MRGFLIEVEANQVARFENVIFHQSEGNLESGPLRSCSQQYSSALGDVLKLSEQRLATRAGRRPIDGGIARTSV